MCTCHTIIINIGISYYIIIMSCTNLMLSNCGFLSRVRTTTRVEPGLVLSGLNWVEPGLHASAHMYIHDVSKLDYFIIHEYIHVIYNPHGQKWSSGKWQCCSSCSSHSRSAGATKRSSKNRSPASCNQPCCISNVFPCPRN